MGHRIPLLSILYAALILPIVGFLSGLSLGRRHGFCPLYPIACGAVILVFLAAAWLFYDFHLGWSRIPVAMLSTFAGNLAGAACHRRRRRAENAVDKEAS